MNIGVFCENILPQGIAASSKTSVTNCYLTVCHIPELSNRHQQCCSDLKLCSVKFFSD